MKGFMFIVIVGGFGLTYWFFDRRRRHLKGIAALRDPAQAAATYAAAFGDVRGSVPADICMVIQRILPVANFPVLPDDDLWKLYDLDQGSLETEIEEYLSASGRQWVRLGYRGPVHTVADLVRNVAQYYELGR